MEDSTIKDMGRWRSNAFQRYISRDQGKLAGLAKMLTGTAASDPDQ